jgi:regulatory protein
MKITAIKAQVKTQGRYSIYVDEKFTFGLSELGLINSGIRVGHEITAEQLEQYKESAQVDKAYGRVMDLIARRPRSEWELRDYLKRKGQDEQVIEEILNTLSIRGYVNDEDFARRWVESRRLLKPISKRKLQLELKQKRIPDEIIKSVLSEDDADEVEVLQAEIEKKRRQTRYQDETKLIAYLARQGYRYDDIKQALQNLKQ